MTTDSGHAALGRTDILIMHYEKDRQSKPWARGIQLVLQEQCRTSTQVNVMVRIIGATAPEDFREALRTPSSVTVVGAHVWNDGPGRWTFRRSSESGERGPRVEITDIDDVGATSALILDCCHGPAVGEALHKSGLRVPVVTAKSEGYELYGNDSITVLLPVLFELTYAWRMTADEDRQHLLSSANLLAAARRVDAAAASSGRAGRLVVLEPNDRTPSS